MLKCILLVAVLWCVGLSPSHALSVVPLTPAELAARAALIVDAEVTSTRVARVDGRIVTFVSLTVLRTTKQDAAQDSGGRKSPSVEVVVAQLGGRIDNIAQLVPGQPVLQVGHRYRLHLGAANGPEGARGIIGIAQGVVEIDRNGRPTSATPVETTP